MMSDRSNCGQMNQVCNRPAAAFQFNLPSCSGGHNEYLAVVIPQSSRSSTVSSPTRVEEICCYRKQKQTSHQPKFPCRNCSCENNENKNAVKYADTFANNSYQQNIDLKSKSNVPSSHIRSDERHQNRWCTEYQGTIDECGKKVMQSDERYCRSPIYPKQQFNNPSTVNYNITETGNNRSIITPTVPTNRLSKTTTRKSKQPLKKDSYHNINTLNSKVQMEASCSGQSGSTGYRPMSRCFPKPNMHVSLKNKPVITMHESLSSEYDERKIG